jgi:UrcA family protein
MPYTRTLSLCAAFAITGVGLVALASPAFSKDQPVIVQGPSPDVVTKRVSYADLNLASRPGERMLYRRVGSAVVWVCNKALPAGSMMYEHQDCTKVAWRGASPQIKQAVSRAQEIAATGQSSIAAVAITLTVPR